MAGGANAMKKEPTLTPSQLISPSYAAKHFGALQNKAQVEPQYILEGSVPGCVLVSYSHFCLLINHIQELEEKLLVERIERAEENPSSLISWEDLKRSTKTDG